MNRGDLITNSYPPVNRTFLIYCSLFHYDNVKLYDGSQWCLERGGNRRDGNGGNEVGMEGMERR